MARWVALLSLIMIGNSAIAEIVYCRFERGFQPVTFTKWDTVENTLTVRHGWPEQENTYDNVVVSPLPLGPYEGMEDATTLVIFGDVVALHMRQTNNGTLVSDSNRHFPYEAYMGKIPGRLESSFLDDLFMNENGPRGACWTDALQGELHEGGGKNKGGRGCDHGDRK